MNSHADIPASVDAVTPQWLTQVLSARFPGARISSARISKRIDGTATKLRYALGYADSDNTDAPRSLWVKGGFDPKGAHQGDAFANEVHFFLELAPLLRINTPQCYWGGIDSSTQNGVVVLEDLLNRDATFGQASEPLTPEVAARVLSLQASYHAAFWKTPTFDRFPWLKAGGAIAGANMVSQYFSLWEPSTLLPRFRQVPQTQRDSKRMSRALDTLINNLRHNAICLVHGDSHAANLFFDADGSPGYLDWQHTMRGNWAFDLANFVVTSLDIEDRRTHERSLLTHYLAELAAHGAEAPSFDDAWNTYRCYAMWPFMWVMCPPDVHPEGVCAINTKRACTAIDDLQSVQCLEGFLR